MKKQKERKARMRRRCSGTWRQFRSTMQKAKPRRCIGGNPMFDYVNERLDQLRCLGAAGRLDEERGRLADEYRNLDPVAKRQRLETWRHERAGAQAARAEEG